MRRILHIQIRPSADTATEVMQYQAQMPDLQVERVDLTRPNPDYHRLLEQLFDADSVQTY